MSCNITSEFNNGCQGLPSRIKNLFIDDQMRVWFDQEMTKLFGYINDVKMIDNKIEMKVVRDDGSTGKIIFHNHQLFDFNLN